MSDSCNHNESPFNDTINIDPCTAAWFWILCILSFLNQICRNFVWIWNAQASREALKYDKGDKRRFHLVIRMLWYTALSFILYVFAFLTIVGGNIYFLISILLGNLVGTWIGMTRQKADSHINNNDTTIEDMISLMNHYRTNQQLSEREINDIVEFKKELQLFLGKTSSAQKVIKNEKTNIHVKF